MEPAEMKKYLVPGLAVAAVIAVGGLLLGLGGPPPENKGSAANTASNDTPVSMTCKPGADTTMDGMCDTPPPSTVGPEWLTLPNGLKIWDVKEGTGDTVSAGKTVAVHYTGWLASNGSCFDSSKSHGNFSEFSLNGVIPGWRDGIPGMKIGGIRRLFIPAAQAYGSRGSGANVPPNSDLIFEVKLLGYK